MSDTAEGDLAGRHPESEQEIVLLTRAQAYLEFLAERLTPDRLLVDGWNEFYAVYGEFIRRAARRHGLQDADVDDCIGDVWFAVVKRLVKFRHDPERPRLWGWLKRLVENKVLDTIRRGSRHPVQSLDALKRKGEEPIDGGPEPDEAEEVEDRKRKVWEVLELLRTRVSEANYQAFHMRWFEGRSVAEVAAVQDVSPTVVWQRHHRTQETFRELWLEHASS